MPPPARHPVTRAQALRRFLRRALLPIAIGAMIFTALLPARWLVWASWFGDLTPMLAAPVSHPITLVGRAVRPPERTRVERNIDQLEEELQVERLARLQAEVRNARLVDQLAVLLASAAHNPDVPVRQIPAPVVGESAGLPVVAMGSNAGLSPGDVATTRGVQLVGRAAQVGERTTRVVPITHPDAPPLTAVVMLDDAGARTRACLLAPGSGAVSGGALEGDLAADNPDDPAPVEPGMTVRLADDAWPDAATMLIVGVVESVTRDPDAPLRETVIVRPTAELARVDEIVFRVPTDTTRLAGEDGGEDGGAP